MLSVRSADFAKFILFKTGHRSNETDLVVTILDGLHCAKYNQLPIPDWAEERWNSIDFGLRLLVAESPINQLSYFGNYLGKFVSKYYQSPGSDLTFSSV